MEGGSTVTWFKIDDNFADHPKFVGCTDSAIASWVRALAYSSRYLTDGFIPLAAQRVIGPAKAVKQLVNAGLLVETLEGWMIHDYTDHQRTRAEVQADRDRNAERSRAYRSRKRHGVTQPLRAYRESESEVDEDNHHQARSQLQPVDNSAGVKIDQAIEIIAERRCQGLAPKNPDAYKAKVRNNLVAELGEKAADLLTRYDPPADVLAAALEGETHSLGHYRRSSEVSA